MSAAAAAEDNTEKAPVTPGPLAPARELYGFMLLDRGMAKEAVAAFEATMAKEPNRFNGYVGAAKAAEMLGDTQQRKRFTESWSHLRPARTPSGRRLPPPGPSSQATRVKADNER